MARAAPVHRSFDEEAKYIKRVDGTKFRIDVGFVPGMKVRSCEPSA